MTEEPVGHVIDVVWEHRGDVPRLPVSWLSAEELAVELQRVQVRRARDAAYEAELIMGLAAARPVSGDPPPGSPGARKPGWAVDEAYAGVSEFFSAELSAVLNLGRGTAAYRHGRAHTWLTKLPATFAALAAGELDERRATALAEVLAHASPEIAGRVEAALLGRATDLSVARLRARATEELLRLDAAAADERRAAAERAADVHVHPSPSDGRATLAADLPTEEAVECFDLVDQLARMLKADGDDRPIGALRAHVLSLLVRRPADSGLPPVSANMTITAELSALAGTGSTPGEVSGLPITAAHVRDLLTRVGALGLTTPHGGTLTFTITGPDGELLATLMPAELTRLARRGCPTHPDIDGAVGDCGCRGDRADAGDRRLRTHRPAARFRHHPRPAVPVPQLRATRRLGRPGPRHRPPARVQGPAASSRVVGARGSFNFAHGWRFTMSDDGTLHVTTPSGVTRTTRPAGLRPRREPDAPPAASSPDEAPPF